MQRLALMLLLGGCQRVDPDRCRALGDVSIRDLSRSVELAALEELRGQLDEFAAWVGRDRVCLIEVTFESSLFSDHFEMSVDGEYRPAERRVRLVADKATPELVRHELCHALDDQNRIVADAPVLWGSEAVVGDAPGERYESLPSEVFARACAAHPTAVLYDARLEREGCIPRDPRLAFLADEVWVGSPPAPEYAVIPTARRYELRNIPTERFAGVDGWLVAAGRPSPSTLEVAYVDVASGERVATQFLAIDESARDFGLFAGEGAALVIVGPPGHERLILVETDEVIEVTGWAAGQPLLGLERGDQFWYADGAGPHVFDLSTHATTDIPLPEPLLEVWWAGFQAEGHSLVGLGWTDAAHAAPVALDVGSGAWSYFAAFPQDLDPAKGVVTTEGLLTAVWAGGLARVTTDAVAFDDAGCDSPGIGRDDGSWVAVPDGWAFVSTASAAGEDEVTVTVFE